VHIRRQDLRRRNTGDSTQQNRIGGKDATSFYDKSLASFYSKNPEAFVVIFHVLRKAFAIPAYERQSAGLYIVVHRRPTERYPMFLRLHAAIHALLVAGPVVASMTGLAHAQNTPRAFCVTAASLDTGSVRYLGAWPDDGALVGAERGLFLARARDGRVSVTQIGDREAGLVLTSHRFPGGALIGTMRGLLLARTTAGAVNVATIEADTGEVLTLQTLPGAGVLVGTEKGAFLARGAVDGVAITPLETDTGRVFEMFPFATADVLIGAAKGWFVARNRDGKTTLVAAGEADTGYARSTKTLPGIGLLIEAQAGWFLARERGSAVTIAPLGDATTGQVAAAVDLPDGRMLLHTQNGWFFANSEGGHLVFTRTAGPDVERVYRMIAVRDGALVYSKNGWFVARLKDNEITFIPTGPFEQTQFAQYLHELPGGAVLIGDAFKGLFVIRPSAESPMLARAGERNTGYVSLIRDMPGSGALVGTQQGFFLASDENGRINLTPVGAVDLPDTGRVLMQPRHPGFASQDLPDGTVLIGAERGLFAAVPGPCTVAKDIRNNK
jgi:predicted RNA binding protein YcfA (HicA-like mRNA interferase family)